VKHRPEGGHDAGSACSVPARARTVSGRLQPSSSRHSNVPGVWLKRVQYCGFAQVKSSAAGASHIHISPYRLIAARSAYRERHLPASLVARHDATSVSLRSL